MATKDISDLQVLKAYSRSRDLGKFPEEILQEETGECEKVCFKAMERAHDRGLIEYGCSLRSGWLTDKGKSHLRGLFEVGGE